MLWALRAAELFSGALWRLAKSVTILGGLGFYGGGSNRRGLCLLAGGSRFLPPLAFILRSPASAGRSISNNRH